MLQLDPEPLYRFGANRLIRSAYSIEYKGFDHIPKTGPALLIANHVSYVDGLVIQAGCDRPIRFVIDHYIYGLPIINYFMRHNDAIPILPKKDHVARALDQVSEALEQGDLVCIFPEGRITSTGHLGRFKPGIVWIIDRDPVPIYPIALRGLWGSVFSRKYTKSSWRFMPKGFRPRVRAICGKEIHPGHVTVNYLQRAVLGLH